MPKTDKRLKWLKTAKVGDLVTSDFIKGCEGLVRRITYIGVDENCASGYAVEADGGEPCECCGRTEIPAKSKVDVGIDGSWFEPYTGTEDKQ